jgi:decaprenyl-phosphate phosphoribosyltransferase
VTNDVEPAPEPVRATASPPAGDVARRRPLALALLVEARPKQWAKNVLVFAAPGAAGVLTHRTEVLQTLVAFAAFCLAASGTYYLNDAGDVASDRAHPTKRHRPIAAGEIPVRLAQVIGGLLIAAGVALSFLAQWELAVVVAVYVVLTTLYTVWLKHVVVFDVVAVAAGFVLRAIGGASATHVEVSNWFFIIATFGSLFMVAGKRHAEARVMGPDSASTRTTLGEYSEPYLEYLRSVSTGVVLVAYCLWAFEKADAARLLHQQSVPWFQLSIVPFGIAFLRYALLVDQGHGGAPEDVVMSDRILQAVGVAWVALFAIGLHYT